ncbi:MAG: hypothetical protein ACLTE2_06195 [Eubacteriales bacterium]
MPLKICFGVVPGLMKPELHCRFPDKKEFSEMLVDLCVRPYVRLLRLWTAVAMGMEGKSALPAETKGFIGTLIGGINPYLR